MGTVSLSDQATWPQAVSDFVAERVIRFSHKPESAQWLRTDYQEEEDFRDILVPSPLRVYHATRLLNHEVIDVREHGLRLADQQLIAERVATAVAAGALTRTQGKSLLRNTTFALKSAGVRDNQICFVSSVRIFEEQPQAFGSLHQIWGGEVMYAAKWGHDPKGVPAYLRIGQPAIVVARIDLARCSPDHLFWPALLKQFLGVALDLPQAW
jgi:hypothetical protein